MKIDADIFESKYIRNLRKQIIKLKRENAQLKKKNHRLEYAEDYSDCDDEEVFIDDIPVKSRKECDISCSHCSNSYGLDFFTAGKYEFYRCSSCNSKGRIDKEFKAG